MKTPTAPPKKTARLEIVPLIDVIFFLLATFILVSLTMTQQPGVRVALPESRTSELHELAENITITISKQALPSRYSQSSRQSTKTRTV